MGRPHRTGNSLTRLIGGLLVVTLGLGGCTALSGGETNKPEENKGYVAGDGSVTEFEPADRGEPITVTGADTAGKKLSSNDFRGKVVVLNLWYAACGPCRDEADDLAELAKKNTAQAQFLGINTRDEPATAASFERTFETPYPSIVDSSGDAVLALRGVATPNAVPTTLVLDRQGRVAGRVSGRVDPSILDAIIRSTAEEK